MSKQDQSGPAFPQSGFMVQAAMEAIEGAPISRAQKDQALEDAGEACAGMTLRDYFAAKALEGDLASQSLETGEWMNDTPQDYIERRCAFYYRMADAMLKVGAA